MAVTVDIFSKETFESKLPVAHTEIRVGAQSFKSGDPLWEHLGAFDNEHCYLIKLDTKVAIYIRSSVSGTSGMSKGSGQDSIRCWLVTYELNQKLGIFNVYKTATLGSKTQKYITRVEGWGERMLKVIKQLYALRKLAGDCFDCDEPLLILKVNKDTINKGRMFGACKNRKHKSFKWLD